MKASRLLLAGIVAVCTLAIIAAACSGPDATHSKSPTAAVPSLSGLVMVRPGPAPLIPPPDAQVTTGSTPIPMRGPAMPPDTVMLDTLARQGKADVLP